MTKSFQCADTEALADDIAVRRFGTLERVARRKLEMLEAETRYDLKMGGATVGDHIKRSVRPQQRAA
jgi:plasmid maintenance system killer protein